MFDKAYYDEKKQKINIKYVKALEVLADDQAALLNKFFTYKSELNEELREIAKREIEAGEGAEDAAEQPAIPTKEEIEAMPEDEAPAEEADAEDGSK